MALSAYELLVGSLPQLAEGLWATLRISLLTIVFSVAGGIGFGLLRTSRLLLARLLSGTILELVRSVPILVWLFSFLRSADPLRHPSSRIRFGPACPVAVGDDRNRGNRPGSPAISSQRADGGRKIFGTERVAAAGIRAYPAGGEAYGAAGHQRLYADRHDKFSDGAGGCDGTDQIGSADH